MCLSECEEQYTFLFTNHTKWSNVFRQNILHESFGSLLWYFYGTFEYWNLLSLYILIAWKRMSPKSLYVCSTEKNQVVQLVHTVKKWKVDLRIEALRIVKQNRFKNLGELHKEWTEAGVKASRATTHRRVKEFGYSCRIPLVKPLLNHRQRQRRLTWAKEKKNWTVAQWSKVLFSDESKFCI